jgi:hypothetical protein
MPLKKGKSKATISSNIKEFHTGATYAATKAKFGKAKADKQAVAVAMSTARKSGGKVLSGVTKARAVGIHLHRSEGEESGKGGKVMSGSMHGPRDSSVGHFNRVGGKIAKGGVDAAHRLAVGGKVKSKTANPVAAPYEDYNPAAGGKLMSEGEYGKDGGDNSRGFHHPAAHAKSLGKGRW